MSDETPKPRRKRRPRNPLAPKRTHDSPEHKFRNPNSMKNLIPCKPGEVRNPQGHNGQRARKLFEAFMLAPSAADPKITRFEQMLMAGYTSGLKAGTQGAQDRKAAYDQLMGKAKEAFTVTGENGGPIRTETTATALSPEEMAARFMRATRIAQEITEKAKNANAIPVDAIEVGANATPEQQIPAGPVVIEASASPPIGAMIRDAMQAVKPAENKTSPPVVGMIPTRR